MATSLAAGRRRRLPHVKLPRGAVRRPRLRLQAARRWQPIAPTPCCGAADRRPISARERYRQATQRPQGPLHAGSTTLSPCWPPRASLPGLQNRGPPAPNGQPPSVVIARIRRSTQLLYRSAEPRMFGLTDAHSALPIPAAPASGRSHRNAAKSQPKLRRGRRNSPRPPRLRLVRLRWCRWEFAGAGLLVLTVRHSGRWKNPMARMT